MNNFNVHFNPWAGGMFGCTPGGGMRPSFFQPPFGFGAGLANGWMRHAAQGMNGGCGGWGFPCGRGGSVPREGQWNADKGSYTVGRSGRLEMKVGQSDATFNNNMQYRVNGGDWQTLAQSKDTGDKTVIHAPPGSNVQFRIQTPEGNTFRAGTTRNSDGIDHAKVNRTRDGYTLGFEDLRGGVNGDFNDAILQLRDPGRRY